MDLQLQGKRALVTGGSSGLGEGIAKVLAHEGVSVVVHGRNEERANRVVQEIAASGGKAFVAIGDLATEEGASQVANAALSSLGGVDILVNNAGVFERTSWMDVSPKKWAEKYNINVVSMVQMIQLLVPQMKELGWGRIIQMSSRGGTLPGWLSADYCATKAAIINMSVGLAQELAETGITVNTISPGEVITSVAERFLREEAASQNWGTDWEEIEKHALKELQYNPTGRYGRVEEVANLVAFVSSPLVGYINGTNIHIDGGSTPTIN